MHWLAADAACNATMVAIWCIRTKQLLTFSQEFSALLPTAKSVAPLTPLTWHTFGIEYPRCYAGSLSTDYTALVQSGQELVRSADQFQVDSTEFLPQRQYQVLDHANGRLMQVSLTMVRLGDQLLWTIRPLITWSESASSSATVHPPPLSPNVSGTTVAAAEPAAAAAAAEAERALVLVPKPYRVKSQPWDHATIKFTLRKTPSKGVRYHTTGHSQKSRAKSLPELQMPQQQLHNDAPEC